MGAFEILGALLDAHAAGDFAHGGEQRQAAEVVGGIAFGSLALLSDAAHMGTDVLGLGMALAAITLANRPGPRRRRRS